MRCDSTSQNHPHTEFNCGQDPVNILLFNCILCTLFAWHLLFSLSLVGWLCALLACSPLFFFFLSLLVTHWKKIHLASEQEFLTYLQVNFTILFIGQTQAPKYSPDCLLKPCQVLSNIWGFPSSPSVLTSPGLLCHWCCSLLIQNIFP